MKSPIDKFPIAKFPLAGFLLCAGLGSLVPAMAQTSMMPQAAPPFTSQAPPAVASPNYQIAAGDVLNVNVADFPNLSIGQAVVTPDGAVSLPLIGQVTVAKRTVSQAGDLLTTKWKKYVVSPSVTVSIVQMHSQTIVFSGSVIRPGVLQYRPELHLIEALAEAGGVITTANAGSAAVQIADPTHVVITHEDGTKQTLDLSDPKSEAGTATDIALTPGDVVYVPEETGKVNIVGEVKQPLVIPYRANLTILEAISECGSFNPDTADLVNAHLTHNGQDMPINLDPLLRHGDMAQNIALSPGDRLVIPELKNRTFIFGDVIREGYYLYKPGDRILDALSGAGGTLQQADLGKINLIHTDKVHNTTQMVRVNLNDFLLRNQLSGNPFVGPGDSIYIPDKHHTFTAQDILNAASGVGSLAYTRQILQHP